MSNRLTTPSTTKPLKTNNSSNPTKQTKKSYQQQQGDKNDYRQGGQRRLEKSEESKRKLRRSDGNGGGFESEGEDDGWGGDEVGQEGVVMGNRVGKKRVVGSQQQQQQEQRNHGLQSPHSQPSPRLTPKHKPLPSSYQQPPHHPTPMLTFISSLYSKYPLLNKLSQPQSSLFQTEVIQMLIDEHQCVDQQLYQQTVEKIGLSTFVLEVLGGVMQKRNKFKNQFQMSRNLEEVVKEVERKGEELGKRRREVERREKEVKRKEEELKRREEELMEVVKERLREIEEKVKGRVLAVEEEVKKRVNRLIIMLKSKEKELVDKVTAHKESLKKLKNLDDQQKSIEQKLKQLQTKQKQLKTLQAQQQKQQNLATQQTTKKLTQQKTLISSLQETNKKLKDDITRLNKKIKINEMAYRHTKEEMDRKLVGWAEERERLREMGEEVRREKEERERLEKEVERLGRLIERSEGVIQKSEGVIDGLRRQNQSLMSRLQTPAPATSTSPPPLLTFDTLDISRIQHPLPSSLNSHQQFLTTTDRQQYSHQQEDESVLQHMAESILVVMDRKERTQVRDGGVEVEGEDGDRSIVDQVRVGYGERDGEEEEEEEEESRDYNREREYFAKRQQLKQRTLPKLTKEQPIKQTNKFNPRPNNPYNTTTPKPLTRTNQLKQQQLQQKSSEEQEHQQLLSNQHTIVPPPATTQSRAQNILLFDNYFASTNNNNNTSTNNNPQPSTKKTNHQTTAQQSRPPNLHTSTLTQLTSYLPTSSPLTPCLTLSSLTPPTLSSITRSLSSPQLKHPRSLVQPFLQLLLHILQPCECQVHRDAVRLLFTQEVIGCLQEILLKFEAVVKEIEEKCVVVLARVLLTYENQRGEDDVDDRDGGKDKDKDKDGGKGQYKDKKGDKPIPKFVLKDRFLKSLKVKLLLETDQFIRSNIRFLLEYQ